MLPAVLAFGFVLGMASTASAERLGDGKWNTDVAIPARTITLLDARREAARPRVDLSLRAAASARAAAAEEPGEALSAALERMWSQVRAKKRPGGAELIVRGRF